MIDRYLTVEDARDTGVLMETNRRLLHPRGLVLEGTLEKDGKPVYLLPLYEQGLTQLRALIEHAREHDAQPGGWTDDLERLVDEAEKNPRAGIFRIRDGRDDPEGFYLPEADAVEGMREEKALAFDRLLLPEREARLGYIVQPL